MGGCIGVGIGCCFFKVLYGLAYTCAYTWQFPDAKYYQDDYEDNYKFCCSYAKHGDTPKNYESIITGLFYLCQQEYYPLQIGGR